MYNNRISQGEYNTFLKNYYSGLNKVSYSDRKKGDNKLDNCYKNICTKPDNTNTLFNNNQTNVNSLFDINNQTNNFYEKCIDNSKNILLSQPSKKKIIKKHRIIINSSNFDKETENDYSKVKIILPNKQNSLDNVKSVKLCKASINNMAKTIDLSIHGSQSISLHHATIHTLDTITFTHKTYNSIEDFVLDYTSSLFSTYTFSKTTTGKLDKFEIKISVDVISINYITNYLAYKLGYVNYLLDNPQEKIYALVFDTTDTITIDSGTAIPINGQYHTIDDFISKFNDLFTKIQIEYNKETKIFTINNIHSNDINIKYTITSSNSILPVIFSCLSSNDTLIYSQTYVDGLGTDDIKPPTFIKNSNPVYIIEFADSSANAFTSATTVGKYNINYSISKAIHVCIDKIQHESMPILYTQNKMLYTIDSIPINAKTYDVMDISEHNIHDYIIRYQANKDWANDVDLEGINLANGFTIELYDDFGYSYNPRMNWLLEFEIINEKEIY